MPRSRAAPDRTGGLGAIVTATIYRTDFPGSCRVHPIDGMTLVDAHVHVPVLGSLKPAWIEWARRFGPDGLLDDVWAANGTPRPARLDELFAAQGVDHAVLFCEYSPKATGMQRFEDLLPIVAHNPVRFRPMGNVNPQLLTASLMNRLRQTLR